MPVDPPPVEHVQQLFDRLVPVLDGHGDALIQAVISNLVAAAAMASMDGSGTEPYSVARHIHRNAKENIKRNLAARGMLSKLPQGARRH